MKVVSLAHFRCRETIAVLRLVLQVALNGDIDGLALCYREAGQDKFAFTGIFKVDSAAALKAGSRMAWKMNQAVDATEFADSAL